MDAPLSLRQVLRLKTRDSHDRTDAAFSALDPGVRGPFATLLRSHLAALATLQPRSGPDAAEVRHLLDEMTSALRDDLDALGAAPPGLPPVFPVDALALLYVLRGSRMGTQILARRWRAATAGTGCDTARAGRYLTLDPQTDRWRSLCGRLEALPGTDAAAHRTVTEAVAIFDHFAAALALNATTNSTPRVPEAVNV